ncbi:zincin [Thozetella sp. PMI_491]|nr:zincin [Thozetella sp. PMI_491]
MTYPFPPRPRILNAAELLPTVYTIINQYRQLHNKILQVIVPEHATFSNVVRPLADLQNQSQSNLDIIHLLRFVSTDLVTQQASKQAIEAYKTAVNTWTRDPKLFQLLKAIRCRNENLDRESALWLEQEFLQYTLLGHERLTYAEIDRFADEELHLSSSIEKFPGFGEGGVWLSEDELQGVHTQIVDTWRRDTRQENEGKIYVPLTPANMWAILPEATHPETRRKVHVAAEVLSPENAGRFKMIVIHRDGRARDLGFKNHAEYCSARTLSLHPDDAEKFLANMRGAHMAGTSSLLAMLQSLRIRDLKDRGLYTQGDEMDFPAWDYDYYLERLCRKRGVDELAISRYFTMDHTIGAILHIISQCFRLRFQQVPPQELNERDIWHKDVQVWGVWEAGPDNLFVGYLYLDLYQRDKKERGPEVKILEELLDALIETKAFYSTSKQSFHLEMASLDMRIHKPRTRRELVEMDIRAMSSQIRVETRGLGYPRCEDIGGYPTRYMHMLLGRYDASTYSYISGAVFAHDIYQTVFAKDTKNPDAWGRFRREILEYGGSYGDEAERFEKFLGRPFDVYALSKRLQLELERIGEV